MIREEILRKRKNLSQNQLENYSHDIIERLKNSKYYRDAKTIMTFISFLDEVHTHDFIKDSIKLGKKILVPITIPENKELKPSQVKDFDELEPGFYDILSPKEEFVRYVDPKEIDLIVVPGVAFAKDGYRVGYGGGYYDRFLSKLPGIPTIAIGYDIQVVDQVPTESFDIPVDFIYTEKREIDARQARKD